MGELSNTTNWRKMNLDDYDRVIWLGNIFVSSSNKVNLADMKTVRRNTIELLQLRRTNPAKHVLLLGKDDLSLLFPETYGNSGAITNMPVGDRNAAIGMCRSYVHLFKFFHSEKDTLFSYAGITKRWYNSILPYAVKLGGAGLTTDKRIDTILNRGMLMKSFRDAITQDFGADDEIGPYWMDWETLKKHHIKGLNQIVGYELTKKIKAAGNKNTGQLASINFLPYVEGKNPSDINVLTIS